MALSFQDKIRPVATSTKGQPSFAAKARPVSKPQEAAAPAEPTLMSRLVKRADSFAGAPKNLLTPELFTRPKEVVGRTLLRASGAVGGAINDVSSAVISPIVKKEVDVLSNYPLVQKVANNPIVSKGVDLANAGVSKAAEKGSQFMASLPAEKQQDVRDLGNTLSVLPLGKAAKAADPIIDAAKGAITTTPEKVVAKRAAEIAKIEDNYASTRKANDYSKDAGDASRQRVAYTDVLTDAVDENGLMRTKQPGGAYEKYKAQTIDKKETVVRKLLENENVRVHLNDVKAALEKAIGASGLEGADLTNALNNVKKEIAGYRLKADKSGTVPLTQVHDAKISNTQGINFLTEPNVKTSRKAIARALKEIIETKSKEKIKDINAELSKYYSDLALIERLDGKRVRGGKLGKYTSRIAGNMGGGIVGGIVGGPVGAALGVVVGGEITSKLAGRGLSRILGKKTGLTAPESQILKDAQKRSLKGTQTPQYNAMAQNIAPKVVIPQSVLPSAKPSSTRGGSKKGIPQLPQGQNQQRSYPQKMNLPTNAPTKKSVKPISENVSDYDIVPSPEMSVLGKKTGKQGYKVHRKSDNAEAFFLDKNDAIGFVEKQSTSLHSKALMHASPESFIDGLFGKAATPERQQSFVAEFKSILDDKKKFIEDARYSGYSEKQISDHLLTVYWAKTHQKPLPTLKITPKPTQQKQREFDAELDIPF
jgi:hypothetical protein